MKKHLKLPALLLTALLLAGSASAQFTDRTEVRWFAPLGPEGVAAELQIGAELEGECFGPSLASSSRADAWRCSAGSSILDPCFAGAWDPDGGAVLVCAQDPFGGEVSRLTLEDDLPDDRETVAGGLPWAVELPGPELCTLLTGATASLAGKRIDYGCEGGGVIAGGIGQDGPVWTALYRAEGSAYLTLVPVVRAWF